MNNSEKEEKKTKKEKFNIKELYTNRQYRSIIILIFYVVLFAVLIVNLRSEKSGSPSNNEFNNYIKGFQLIEKNNFSYKYVVQTDNETFTFEGKKYKNEDMFSLSSDGSDKTNDYFVRGNDVYIKENNKYVLSYTKPIVVFDFLNTKLVNELISRATAIEGVSNKYEISNQSLYDVLSDDNIRVQDGKNYITLYYRNSNITKIEFDLSNYSVMLGEKYKELKITLEYYDFDLIEKFDVNI